MWLPNPIACDVCGSIKKDANHWYYAELRPRDDESFQIWHWDWPAEDRERKGIIHLCGQACATKKMSEWMEGDKGEARPVLSVDPPSGQIYPYR